MTNYFSLKDGDFRSSGVFGASINDLSYRPSTTNQYVNTFGVLASDNFSDIFTISNTAITAIAIQIDKIYSTSGNLRLDINYTTDNTTLCAVTEYYPLTSFSNSLFTGTRTFDYNSVFPEKFQLLRLTNPISAASASVRYKLTTPSDNQIYLNGIPRFNGLINLGSSTGVSQGSQILPITALDGSIQFDGEPNSVNNAQGGYNKFLKVGDYTDSSLAATNVQMGGTQFTVEGFVKFPDPSTGIIAIYKDGTYNVNLFSWGCIIKQSGLVFQIGSATNNFNLYQTYSAAPATIPANTWRHFSFTKYNWEFRIHLNGVLLASFDMSTYNNGKFKDNSTGVSIGNSNTYKTPLHIGRSGFNGGNGTNSLGYVANVRVTTNTALYSSDNFSPPIPNWLQSIDNGIFTVNKITTVGPTPKFNASVVTTNSVPLSSTSPDNVYICRSIYPNSAVVPINITANSNLTVNNLYVYDQGTLSFPLTSNTTIRANGSYGIGVSLSGTLNIGTSSSPIPLSTTHAINLYDNAINVYENGNLNVYGYAKPFTTNLISDVGSSVRTFSATDSISGTWSVGDTLAFKPNLASRTSFDYLILSSFVDSNVFTTTSNSSYSHTGSATYGFIPTVYNLSRNVKINGVDTTYRGTIRSYDSSKVNINYTQLSSFGLSNKSALASGYAIHPKNNTSGYCTLSGNSFINDGNNETVLFKNNFNYTTYYTTFNGTTDAYDMSNANNVTYLHNGTTDWTIEVWVYITAYYSTNQTIIHDNRGGAAVGICLWISANTGLPRLIISNSTSPTNIYGSTPVPINKWSHICITFNTSTKTYSFYIDGIISNYVVNPVTSYSSANSQNRFSIGKSYYLLNNFDTAYNFFNGTMSNLRIRSVVQYTSNFTPTYILPVIDSNTTLLTLQNSTIKDNGTGNYTLTAVGSPTIAAWQPYNYVGDDTVVNNTTISNNIFWKSKNPTTTGIIPLQNYNLNTFKFNNNYILNSYGDGLILSGNTGAAANVTNNVIIGALGNGTYLTNNTLSGSLVNNNYANGSYGMLLSGGNNLNLSISGGGIYSGKDGIYVDTSTVNINSLQFNNVVTSNNASVGFNLSGASLVYSTPIYLNINGLTASNNTNQGVNINSSSFNLSSITLNNTVANSNSSIGFKLSGNNLNYSNAINLNINGLESSSNKSYGIEAYNIKGNLSSLTINNNLSGGIRTSIGHGYITFDGLSSTTSGTCLNILSAYNYYDTTIKNSYLSSNGICLILDSTRFGKFSIENSTLSSTTPIQINTTRNLLEGSYLFNKNYMGNISFVDLNKYQTNVYKNLGFAFMSHNNLSGNHFSYVPGGTKVRDTVIYDPSTTDDVSERLTPITFNTKLRSSSKFVAINSGDLTNIRVNVLVVSSYNGNPPRLILKRNPSAGVYSDMVLDSYDMSLGYNEFFELVGPSPYVIDNSILEFYVDCDGTSGYICVDTWYAK